MSWKEFDRMAEDYDKWYEEHPEEYGVELSCLRSFRWESPSLEVGVGTGRFSSALGIDVGLDAALKPLILAMRRGTLVVQGFSENLPFRDSSFKTVFFITSLCFLDPRKSFKEAHRILKLGGHIIACIIPRDSPLGREYSSRGGKSVFRFANFLSLDELVELGEELGMSLQGVCDTLFLNNRPCFSCVDVKKVKAKA